jgi:hypothetical protein
MPPILNSFFNSGNQTLTIVCLSFAAFRVYLEVIDFNFDQLPLSKKIGNSVGVKQISNYHKIGLYICVGYIILFAPGVLLS